MDGGASHRGDGAGLLAVRVAGVVAVVKGFDGLVLEAESDVGVGLGADSDVGVAEEFLDRDEFYALFEQRGGAGAAEVVEAGAAESGVVEEGVEALGDTAGVEGPAGRCGEDQVPLLPLVSGGEAIGVPGFAVLGEGGEAGC
ncbi:hypothetical protein L1885_05800 [Streptomyces fuscigenes]|nr:hypothetical protein [Streptomyces fuscigenes]MCF3961193.1 hypothetical protein [Streptomyces fuscigenes]